MWKLAFRFFFLYLRIYYAKNVIIVTLSFYLDQLSVINLVSSNAEGNFFFLLKSFLAPWVAMVVRLAKAISERWTWLKAGVSFSLFPTCTEPQLSTHTTYHVHTPHIEYTHTTQKAVQGILGVRVFGLPVGKWVFCSRPFAEGLPRLLGCAPQSQRKKNASFPELR